MKRRIEDLEELCSLLDYELRALRYSIDKANPANNKPPRPVNHLLFIFSRDYFLRTGEEMSLYDLRKKFRGSTPNEY